MKKSQTTPRGCYGLTISAKVLNLFIWLLILVLPQSARAQQVKISVLPPQVHILSKPDISLIKAFNFENQGDPGIFSFQIVSFKPRGDQGNLQLLDQAEGPVRFSLENSDKRLGDKFFLPSRDTAQAIVKIRTTDNAPEGDYYYTLLMVSEPPTSQATTGRGSAMIGANILISVTNTGLTPSSVKVAQFQIVPRYQFRLFGKTFLVVEPTDEVPVVLKLANTGAFLITPDAKIQVKGPFGINKSKKMLAVNVLSSSQRLLTTRELDSCGHCQTQPSAVFRGFYFGKYQLSADIGFAGANQKIFGQSEFWALPIKLTKTVLLLFIFAFVLLLFLKSKLKHE
ncbi:hypothetical protein A2313_02565 [Candidatus Roizmanbacteria bacterium RIFOXYB2_FULL_41_10]|uniref:Uncharacterized protein n=1 Tax=Candidatus Roizmanbacteria bacterium RIFOXYA1_FULL_41_12 TaxID=1802082 RepID=A0A1F7K9Y7_9BACT|nr:MAG: hypothetical protein A2209_01295 [Candidatus Roizmanbacteria bacterium RIFOXYA1_FULL_41_12]OGK66711.1 MAG: hypothetical protein A2377_02270 [Candidatus Roizmanbacteria bacterium RIFOXYB1_FULL_41_27]OGK68552.1 MAG: hypothetical protein A2262_04210 [Candidatus Roizmanbacteria bacterium RIFOXYA2_FULL_41_8]OGK70624.1 MAG: hypothetical protein A2313_02565 [Candidatus Roizmanbacteria bacterium RIFOXYB2_FULL_41_10]OGK70915.1 MAG: hypothetical protein A2403_02440 [Candidatus Roizmanbacteria bac